MTYAGSTHTDLEAEAGNWNDNPTLDLCGAVYCLRTRF